MAGAGIRPAPLTPDIAIDASQLPGEPHGDPADRMIVATARHLGASVVTRDSRILAYARRGHVAAIRC
jgi:PIN domain nuclease of toxin-antitoxin system